MTEREAIDQELARRLVIDELFDLTLYRSLRALATGELGAILDRLHPIEARHFAFWQDYFGLGVERLDVARWLKLQLIVLACRLFGTSAIHLVLEAIEVYGVRKYLKVWSTYGAGPRGAAVRSILEDEFEHGGASAQSRARAQHLSRLERRARRDPGRGQRLLRRPRELNDRAHGRHHGGRGGGAVHGRRRVG